MKYIYIYNKLEDSGSSKQKMEQEGVARVGADPVNEARKRDFKKALAQVPRFNGTTPWRLWKMEFALWTRE